MKKLLVIYFGVLFLSANVFAQDKGNFELGVGIGLNLSNISNLQNNQSASLRVGFNFNASGEYYFSESWGIKSRLIFDQKGWVEDLNILNGSSQKVKSVAFNVNYLTIPVMANWHFGSSKNWYLNFGPYFGFLLSAEDSHFNKNFEKGLESFDIGIDLGIGYKFSIADNIKMFVEYDGQSGFVDTIKNNTSGMIIRNVRSFFNVGLLFPL